MPLENRKNHRYQVDAQALYSWEDSQHNRLHGRGVTLDMSVLGAFILTAAGPPIKTQVQVEIFLIDVPRPKSIIRFTGVANVLRIKHFSRGAWQTGFAVVNEGFTRWNMTVNSALGCKSPPQFVIEELKVSGR
jgi:hypothetical protein